MSIDPKRECEEPSTSSICGGGRWSVAQAKYDEYVVGYVRKLHWYEETLPNR
jgi:hypothetical protein